MVLSQQTQVKTVTDPSLYTVYSQKQDWDRVARVALEKFSTVEDTETLDPVTLESQKLGAIPDCGFNPDTESQKLGAIPDCRVNPIPYLVNSHTSLVPRPISVIFTIKLSLMYSVNTWPSSGKVYG